MKSSSSGEEHAASKRALPDSVPVSPAPEPIVVEGIGTKTAAAAAAAVEEREPETPGARRFRRFLVWGFISVSCVVSGTFFAATTALQEHNKAIDDVKARVGCGDMSDRQFAAFLERGQFSAQQAQVLHEHAEQQNREKKMSLGALVERIRSMERHWIFSLRNWDEGRYYTVFTSAFSHGDMWHLAEGTAVAGYLLNMAFRSGRLGPWSVVVLVVGSQAGAVLGFAGDIRYAIRASSARDKDDVLEAEVDKGLVKLGDKGSSGIVSGVATALLVLTPRARVLGLVPLWALVPLKIGKDVYGQSGQDLRQNEREWIVGEHGGGNVSYAAHLGGTAFGVLFALWKLRMGSRV
ncbi:rhomboid-domain-containing protein [Apiospora sp. TS-2023a]